MKSLASIVRGQIALVDWLIAVLMEHPSAASLRDETNLPPSSVRYALMPLLQACGSSANTIITAFPEDGMATRDSFAVARGLFETAVNVCYIMSQGEIAAERASAHASQKSYRDWTRESTVAGSTIRVQFSGSLDPAELARLEQLKSEFEWRSGRERSWTDLTVDQRIESAAALGGRVGQQLHLARFIVYRHSSEVLHGSLFGALWFLGMAEPGRVSSQQDVKRHWGLLRFLVRSVVMQSLAAVVDAFVHAYGFKRAEVALGKLLRLVSELQVPTSAPATTAGPAMQEEIDE